MRFMKKSAHLTSFMFLFAMQPCLGSTGESLTEAKNGAGAQVVASPVPNVTAGIEIREKKVRPGRLPKTSDKLILTSTKLKKSLKLSDAKANNSPAAE